MRSGVGHARVRAGEKFIVERGRLKRREPRETGVYSLANRDARPLKEARGYLEKSLLPQGRSFSRLYFCSRSLHFRESRQNPAKRFNVGLRLLISVFNESSSFILIRYFPCACVRVSGTIFSNITRDLQV